MRRFVFLFVLAASLAAVSTPAHAGVQMIGSDLSAPASITRSHPRDWAAWPTGFATGGGAIVAPAQGEVTTVQFKGTALKPSNPAYGNDFPAFNMFVVILRPQADGTVQVGQAYELKPFPFGGDDQRITTYSPGAEEQHLCVRKGDIVSMSTSGGFGAMNAGAEFGGPQPDDFFRDGYPVRMFGRVPGSGISVFEQPAVGTDDGNGFQGGDRERGTPVAGQELLMRASIGTGADSSFTCQSAEEQQNATVAVPQQPRELAVAGGSAKVRIGCVSLKACPGTVYLKAGSAIIGQGTFTLGGRSEGAVAVALNANGARKLREAGGRLAVTAIVRPNGGLKVEEPGFVLVGGGGGGGGVGSGSALATVVKPKAGLAVRKGSVALKVRCQDAAACAGRLALAKQGTVFGSAAFTVPAGSARTVAVKLNAAAKKALRQAKGPAITVKATAKVGSTAKSVFLKVKRT